jgi:hypothetical protein
MKTQDKFFWITGLTALVTAIAGGIVYGLYWLTLQVSDSAIRWVAVAAVLANPAVAAIAWRLATNAAREHLKGFDRGLTEAEATFTSVARGVGAVRQQVLRTPAQQFRNDNDMLLPHPGGMRIIEAGRSNDDEVLGV